MDIRKIKRFVDLVMESGIAELEIREGEEMVRISRYAAHGSAPTIAQVAGEAAAHPVRTPAPFAEPEPDGHRITAPMVGTFYLAASPTSKPFVEVGKRVKRGDVLCVIEAMKVMNQIESDREGVVTAILAENGQPVEYDQPLLLLQ
ncbi:MAG: acetyl-CoA carboxylase biotin carboxyl carrier protein [Gammaproteobacteria bacterium]